VICRRYRHRSDREGDTPAIPIFDLAKLAKAPIAAEAVRRINEMFEIERMINGKAPGR
jgi:hypothetical protein